MPQSATCSQTLHPLHFSSHCLILQQIPNPTCLVHQKGYKASSQNNETCTWLQVGKDTKHMQCTENSNLLFALSAWLSSFFYSNLSEFSSLCAKWTTRCTCGSDRRLPEGDPLALCAASTILEPTKWCEKDQKQLWQKQPLGAFEFPDGFRSSDGATRWRCLFIWQGAFDKPNAQNHGRPSMITMDTCQDSKNGHNQHEVRRLSCDIHLHICDVVKRWCVYMCIYIYVVYVIPSSL